MPSFVKEGLYNTAKSFIKLFAYNKDFWKKSLLYSKKHWILQKPNFQYYFSLTPQTLIAYLPGAVMFIFLAISLSVSNIITTPWKLDVRLFVLQTGHCVPFSQILLQSLHAFFVIINHLFFLFFSFGVLFVFFKPIC